MTSRSGPLHGVKIVEIAGIGPTPMSAMLLADLGATIIRIDRREPSELGIKRPPHLNLLNRGRHAVAVDLKTDTGRALFFRLVEQADALIEGFRPGTMERLGLGPDECLARNPRLVFGRMTGWGQDGPLAKYAGHDINYMAITGALAAIGERGRDPVVPLNILGDYAGGGLYMAMGLLAAIIEARSSGKGQVVDVAILDGVASLMTNFHGLVAAGLMRLERGTNIVDGGAPYYGVYRCADGGYVAVGPIETRFEALMLERLGIDPAELPPRDDVSRWEEGRAILAQAFARHGRDHWASLFVETDACVSPVLDLAECLDHPQAAARNLYVDVDGVRQPAPAPRFSRTACGLPTAPGEPDAHAALANWMDEAEMAEWLARIA